MNEKVTEAAAKLEELAADMKQAVIDLRESGNQVFAYQRLYNLRTALSRVVQSLGVGVPMRYQAPHTARPVGDGTRATEINHAAEHQAPPGKCVICDHVYAHNPEAYKGD